MNPIKQIPIFLFFLWLGCVVKWFNTTIKVQPTPKGMDEEETKENKEQACGG